MEKRAKLALGGLLIGGSIIGGIAYARAQAEEDDGNEVQGEYRLPVAEYEGPLSWLPGGQDIVRYEGDLFGAKLTFEHRGPATSVILIFRLDMENLGGPGAFQAASSSPLSIPFTAGWATYSIETDTRPLDFMGGGPGWHLSGDVMLVEGEEIVLEVSQRDIYYTQGPAYQGPISEFWD